MFVFVFGFVFGVGLAFKYNRTVAYNDVRDQYGLQRDGVKLMGVQIPLSIIAMPLRRAYALPGAIFLVSA